MAITPSALAASTTRSTAIAAATLPAPADQARRKIDAIRIVAVQTALTSSARSTSLTAAGPVAVTAAGTRKYVQ